jgi:predicted transcriptional regulator YdeE
MITKIETTLEPAFSFLGIVVRTTNENNQSQKDLGELWEKFLGGNLQKQISGRLSDDLFSVYMEYETDYTGYYTAMLGCKVDIHSPVKKGFSRLIIPESRYQVHYLSDSAPQIVGEAWREIWESGLQRAYTFDFDRYINDGTSSNPEVRIYVAI